MPLLHKEKIKLGHYPIMNFSLGRYMTQFEFPAAEDRT
jgi:hypothetical protein